MEKEKKQILKLPRALNQEIAEECEKIGIKRNRHIFIKQLLDEYKSKSNMDSMENRVHYLETLISSHETKINVINETIRDIITEIRAGKKKCEEAQAAKEDIIDTPEE